MAEQATEQQFIETSDGRMRFAFRTDAEGKRLIEVASRTFEDNDLWSYDYCVSADELARALGHHVLVEDNRSFLYGSPSEESDYQILIADSPDDAVGDILDQMDPSEWPATVRVGKWARRKIGVIDGLVLSDTLERLDEEYGDPDDTTTTEPSVGMKEAEKRFIDRVLSEYRPLAYEEVEVLTISVPEWRKRNRHLNYWLEMLDPQQMAARRMPVMVGGGYSPCTNCGMPSLGSPQLRPLWDGNRVVQVLRHCWSCNRQIYDNADPRSIAGAVRTGIKALPHSDRKLRY